MGVMHHLVVDFPDLLNQQVYFEKCIAFSYTNRYNSIKQEVTIWLRKQQTLWQGLHRM